MFGMKTGRKRIVTMPQQGERTRDGEKLMRKLRHKNLRPFYIMIGSKKPWQSKLKRRG